MEGGKGGGNVGVWIQGMREGGREGVEGREEGQGKWERRQ